MYPWDYAAGSLIVTEAGGKMSLIAGGKPTMLGLSEPLMASNGLIHDELAQMFKDI